MQKSDVIAHFGTVSDTAKALGITSQAVSMWPEIVPLSRQWQIENITSGSLKADSSQSSPAHQAATQA